MTMVTITIALDRNANRISKTVSMGAPHATIVATNQGPDFVDAGTTSTGMSKGDVMVFGGQSHFLLSLPDASKKASVKVDVHF